MSNIAKLVGSIRLAKFMELSEEEFDRFVRETEDSHWYKEFIKLNPNYNQLCLEFMKAEHFNIRGFSKLIKEKELNTKEITEIEELKRRFRLINTRKTIIHKIIEKIRKYQESYLDSGKIEDLKPLTQIMLSKLIRIDNSIISRVVSNGYKIKTANGFIPLRFFFVKKKNLKKRLIKDIMDEEKAWIESGKINKPYSDEQIRVVLKNKHNVIVSRRFVSKCRKELGIGSSYERVTPKH